MNKTGTLDPDVAVKDQTITIHVDIDKKEASWTWENKHIPGRPVIFNAKEECLVRFTDPETFGVHTMVLHPGHSVTLPTFGKRTEIEVYGKLKVMVPDKTIPPKIPA